MGTRKTSGGISKTVADAPPGVAPDSKKTKTVKTTSQSPRRHSADKALEKLTTEDLTQRIAQAAYYRAERRGFAPGHELADWLEAEQEINSAGK